MADRHYRVTIDLTAPQARTDRADIETWLSNRLTDFQLHDVTATEYERGTATLIYVDTQDNMEPEPHWSCSECGSTHLQYEESEVTFRSIADESPTCITIGDGDRGDGDDNPGLVCAACGAHLELPEGVEMDWGS